jgi:hypothetical protein
MIPRLLAAYLHRDAGYYPVLAVTGPRQSGKTTLVRTAFPGHEYVSLEEPDIRRFAAEDPRGFLARYSGPVILDDVQRAPELLSSIQTAVDRDSTLGSFVLTGSHNFLLMSTVSQTLAGRCGMFHLLPFSRAELEGSPQPEPRGPEDVFANGTTQLELWNTVHAGFYPPLHDRKIPPAVWYADYVRTYVERDLRAVANIGDLVTFERFLALCAGRVAQLVDASALAPDCGVAVDTVRRWLSILETSFVVFRIRPHHASFGKRVMRTPKLYFHDTGLACHLLGIREVGQLLTHPLRGPLFENYVIAEVDKAYAHHRRESPLFFWRDRTGHEVDLLIEEAGELFPVEIKSGQTVAADMLAGLTWWCALAGRPLEAATLVHGGAEAYTRSGIAVRPWFAV